MTTCNEQLKEMGRTYPRTCAECGLGPCTKKVTILPDLGNFAAFIDRKFAWSLDTFGMKVTIHGVLAHLRKEVDEAERNPRDLEEWADVILLAIEGACRSHFTGEQLCRAIVKKHEKNTKRTWKEASGGGHFEHERKD